MAGGAPDPAGAGVGLCLRLADAVNAAPGRPIVLYDEAGSVTGKGTLGPALAIAESPLEGYEDIVVCKLSFRVDDIRRTRSVTIEIGSQRRATYPADELDAQGWYVELPLGS
jgi:hypothetical protein